MLKTITRKSIKIVLRLQGNLNDIENTSFLPYPMLITYKDVLSYDAEIDLIMLGKNLGGYESLLINGIKAGMKKLSLRRIETKKSFECELFNTYFDPILLALFSNSDKNVVLRWSNVTSDENGEKRPDAIISEIYQYDFGRSQGYGEIKLARPTPDNYDLLRLATFAKNNIDLNQL